jgi:hypothetical protein
MRWMRPSTRIDPPHQFAQLVRRLAPATVVRVVPVGSSLTVPPAASLTMRSAGAAQDGETPA